MGARTIAGLLFVILGAAFLTVTMLAASIAPDYDFSGGAISDLGVIDETAVLFNVLLIATGVLNATGGYLLYTWHRRMWLLAVYLVGAVGAIGAGLLPLDTGGPHALFALVGFLFFNVEAIGTAFVVRGPMKAISLLAGGLGLIFVGIMVIGDGGNPAIFGPIGHGGAERMIVYPVMVWLLALGGYFIGRDETAAEDRRSANG
ncbi:MAG TPA: DUF998 domain-containing protein [Candidatus Limnocylindrales bacterium]|nr:DUF998 domain-containing protein [Candidatus Limnocylindrales bacterium]